MNQHVPREHLATLLESLDRRGDEPAILAFGPEGPQPSASHRLAEQARQFGRGLQQRGLSPGDRVALVAENSVPLVTACLGVIASGGVAAPLDVQMEATTLGQVLEDSGAKVLLTTTEQVKRLAHVLPENIEAVFLLKSLIPAFCILILLQSLSLVIRLVTGEAEG